MKTPLRLSPFPLVRDPDESGSLRMEREGFVDEAVVTALRMRPVHVRSVAYLEDLALACDDQDFAGWRIAERLPVRNPEVPPQVIEAIVRRAAPPIVGEPGLGQPHHGSHRWWLAGLAGALSTLLFSLLLLTLSARPGTRFETILSPSNLTTAKPVSPPDDTKIKDSPELSDISTRP